MFTIGTKGTDPSAQDKKKPTDLQKQAQDRLADTLAIKDNAKNDVKRERDQYAQSLRKQKR